jgi:hypothetical protein
MDTSSGTARNGAAAETYSADRSTAENEEKLSVAKRDRSSTEPAPSMKSSAPALKETLAAKDRTLGNSERTEPQIEDLPPSRWRVMAQQARRAGKTSELAEKFEASFKRTNRADVGLFLLDLRMSPLDKAGLIRTADALNRLGSTSQDFWLRIGQAYEIAGKFNAARISYERALQGSDAKSTATAKTRMERLRSKK